jgi:hypothetical protein
MPTPSYAKIVSGATLSNPLGISRTAYNYQPTDRTLAWTNAVNTFQTQTEITGPTNEQPYVDAYDTPAVWGGWEAYIGMWGIQYTVTPDQIIPDSEWPYVTSLIVPFTNLSPTTTPYLSFTTHTETKYNTLHLEDEIAYFPPPTIQTPTWTITLRANIIIPPIPTLPHDYYYTQIRFQHRGHLAYNRNYDPNKISRPPDITPKKYFFLMPKPRDIKASSVASPLAPPIDLTKPFEKTQRIT